MRRIGRTLARLAGTVYRRWSARPAAQLRRTQALLAERTATVTELRARLAERDAPTTLTFAAAPEGPPPVVQELITTRDRFVDVSADATSRPDGATTLTRWLETRLVELLDSVEVTTIDDTGPLDWKRHEAVAAKPAPRADLVDHIAETVRAGYLWRGQLVRAQQVVAYAAMAEPVVEQ